MFEEKAKEYRKNFESELYLFHNTDIMPEDVEEAYQKGAEFGYNKANEWHYVKDGDLPKDENYVLVSNGKDWTKGFYKDKKWNVISLVGFIRVYAWKEIVPPSEPMRSLDKEEQKNYTEAISKVYKPTGVKLFDKENK